MTERTHVPRRPCFGDDDDDNDADDADKQSTHLLPVGVTRILVSLPEVKNPYPSGPGYNITLQFAFIFKKTSF